MTVRVQVGLPTATPTQARFLAATDRHVLFAAGYGAGKTRAGATKAVQLALLNPGCTGLMIGPTWQMVDRLVLDAFLAACPRELITHYHKSERRIELLGGSRIYFGSADKPGSLEGVTVAWAWVDEGRLISAEAWRTIAGRVRDKGARLLQTYVTTTPAIGWLSEFFDGSPGRLTLHCSTAENRSNLAPGFLEDLRRTYSARLATSLIDGQFTVIAGQVYEEFAETKHVIDWRYDPRLPLWLSWDFGVRAASILFAQQLGDQPVVVSGRMLPPRSIVIFDELQPEQVPTAHQIPLVVRRLRERGVPMDGARPQLDRGLFRIACDPAGAGRDQATGIPSVALLEHAFGGGGVVRYETDFAERHIPNRIQRVTGALAPADGSAPRLYVDRRLVESGERRGVVKALRGSVYPEKGGRQKSDLPRVDDYEHARDTLEYLWVCAENSVRSTSQGNVRFLYGAAGR